jgi:phosphoglycolate phosphatase-like HAD superfamily hydrolase
MVGDSIYDLGAGRAAGVRTAAVTWALPPCPTCWPLPAPAAASPAELAQLPHLWAQNPTGLR